MGISQKIEKLSNYYLVCLSPGNYTSVTYPYPREVKPGMIFKSGDEMIEVTRISDTFAGMSPKVLELTEFDPNEKTLEALPEDQSYILEKELECKFLTGPLKNQKRVITAHSPTLSLSSGNKLTLDLKGNGFNLPSFVEILCKDANQILKGHLSDKILLEKGMAITLEEARFELQIE